MKRFLWWGGIGAVVSLLFISTTVAQTDAEWRARVSEDFRDIKESVKRLNERLDVFENDNARMQKQIAQMQTELRALQENPSVPPKEIERLDAALKQMDAALKQLDTAREKDKVALIDQVAKILDEFKRRELPTQTPKGDHSPESGKHTVQKGEYLSTIAKAYGISVSELKKANKLTSDTIREGQVLLIPKKN